MLTPDLFTSNFSRDKAKIDWLLSMKAPFGQAGREDGTVWMVLASARPKYRQGASYLLLKCGVDVNMKKASLARTRAYFVRFCATQPPPIFLERI